MRAMQDGNGGCISAAEISPLPSTPPPRFLVNTGLQGTPLPPGLVLLPATSVCTKPPHSLVMAGNLPSLTLSAKAEGLGDWPPRTC